MRRPGSQISSRRNTSERCKLIVAQLLLLGYAVFELIFLLCIYALYEYSVGYGASQLHTVSAFIGGVVGTEAAKVLTNQYIPLNNTLLFNGIAGCMAKLKL